jgi:hypothetical protein
MRNANGNPFMGSPPRTFETQNKKLSGLEQNPASHQTLYPQQSSNGFIK